MDRVTDVSNYFQLMIYNTLAIWLAKTCLGIPLVKKFANILTAFIQVDLGLCWERHMVFLWMLLKCVVHAYDSKGPYCSRRLFLL